VAVLVLGLTVGLSVSTAFGAPVAPVISGPTAVQFISHPLGFRGAISWDPVPTATSYRVYDADTALLISTITTPTYMVYGMQGTLYRRYVVAVDGAGDASPPSNTLGIQAVAPVVPALPAGFDLLAGSVFDLQTSAPPAGSATVKVPYTLEQVAGDPADLRLLHYGESGWEDITTSVDTVGQYVNGVTSSFSVFAVMEPTDVPVTFVTTTSLFAPSTARARRVLDLTGAVTPSEAPGTVTIEMSRLEHKVWTSAGSATVAVVDGTYQYSFVPSTKGSWRFVATYTGGVDGLNTYAPSTSDVVAVVVK